MVAIWLMLFGSGLAAVVVTVFEGLRTQTTLIDCCPDDCGCSFKESFVNEDDADYESASCWTVCGASTKEREERRAEISKKKKKKYWNCERILKMMQLIYFVKSFSGESSLAVEHNIT